MTSINWNMLLKKINYSFYGHFALCNKCFHLPKKMPRIKATKYLVKCGNCGRFCLKAYVPGHNFRWDITRDDKRDFTKLCLSLDLWVQTATTSAGYAPLQEYQLNRIMRELGY